MKCLLFFAGAGLGVLSGCAGHESTFWGEYESRIGQPATQPSPVLNSVADQAAQPVGHFEEVGSFLGAMPTGVTVSQNGRVFVNFPRWGDALEYSVGELKSGIVQPYPDAATNQFDGKKPGITFVGVQSVVVDPRDRLWVLDTGTVNMGPPLPDAAKLVCIDLEHDKVTQTIKFPAGVALPTSYFNDVRFDLRRGKAGLAFITDSAGNGPNGIVVVDLDSGESWRRLSDHPSTKADPNFIPTIGGEKLMARTPGQPPARLTMGSDGIAISADGHTLYYTPLVSRHLFSVDVDALADRTRSDADVAATVKDLGERSFASDGLESDELGRIYLTDYENNAVRRRDVDGSYHIVAQDARLMWPDTLSITRNGYLYFICNQLNAQPRFHEGKDLRKRPYSLFRVAVDGQPVDLK